MMRLSYLEMVALLDWDLGGYRWKVILEKQARREQ